MPFHPLSMGNQAAKRAIQALEVVRHHSGYVVKGQVRLQAPLKVVRALLLDFERLDRLHHSIRTSQLQRTFPDGRHRVRVQVQFHLLFFYFKLQSIQDFTWNEHRIHAVMLPENNNFARGELQWELTPRKGNTQLCFRVKLIPAIKVPSLIGPCLLKSILVEQAHEVVNNLEYLAKR